LQSNSLDVPKTSKQSTFHQNNGASMQHVSKPSRCIQQSTKSTENKGITQAYLYFAAALSSSAIDNTEAAAFPFL
jgi:hypothetical protein